MDGLAALVQGVMQKDPFSSCLFVFTNKRRNKVKILTWEKNGFVIWYKRLKRENFAWPNVVSDAVVTLSREQLNWLLDGYDVWRMAPCVPYQTSCPRSHRRMPRASRGMSPHGRLKPSQLAGTLKVDEASTIG
jgi:transposase